MEAIEAVEIVLREEGGPLHYREITERILKKRLWSTDGKTPENTINARLAVDLQERGAESRFQRVDRGVFALRDVRRVKRAGSALTSHPQTSPPRKGPPQQKLGVQEIRSLALETVRSHPEGIRYGQLLASILDEYPATPRNTVQGSIWNLDSLFPAEVHKPSRGLFKPVLASAAAATTKSEPSPRTPERVGEVAFYEPFADWLKNDIGDATDAIAFGGTGLRAKWGTPDVLGVYKPLPSDRVKFPHEIIAAEIKIDPQAPVVAFGQAIAYRLFSTKTYIAMPETIAKEDLDRLEALCMLFGVGLVLFTVDAEQPNFRIRMRAQRFSPDMYFVNEFADGLHHHNREIFNRLFQ